MNKKRGRLEIIQDVLLAIRDKVGVVKQTHILYKSNLSHQMLTEYLNYLIDKGLIEEKVDKKSKKHFILTQKGLHFLQDFEKIKGLVESYGLEEF
ncbi:MAG: winged helix-turn-helix domain-containing protein [Candidatus Woesearchaeota archaeon]